MGVARRSQEPKAAGQREGGSPAEPGTQGGWFLFSSQSEAHYGLVFIYKPLRLVFISKLVLIFQATPKPTNSGWF